MDIWKILFIIGAIVFFVVVFYTMGWAHRPMTKRQRQRLLKKLSKGKL